ESRARGRLSSAFRAAATAASISALSPAGTWAMISCVAGSSTSKVLPLLASTHLPSISMWCFLARNAFESLPSFGLETAMFMTSSRDRVGGVSDVEDRYIPENIPLRGLRPGAALACAGDHLGIVGQKAT